MTKYVYHETKVRSLVVIYIKQGAENVALASYQNIPQQHLFLCCKCLFCNDTPAYESPATLPRILNRYYGIPAMPFLGKPKLASSISHIFLAWPHNNPPGLKTGIHFLLGWRYCGVYCTISRQELFDQSQTSVSCAPHLTASRTFVLLLPFLCRHSKKGLLYRCATRGRAQTDGATERTFKNWLGA